MTSTPLTATRAVPAVWIDLADPARQADPAGSADPAVAESRWRFRRAVYEPAYASDGPARNTIAEPVHPTEDLPHDPAARLAAYLVLRVIVEVLDGRRRPAQLADLATRSVTCSVRVAASRLPCAHLSSVRLFQPHPRAVEIAAVCRSGERSVAIAARLDEARHTGWRCTAFRLI